MSERPPEAELIERWTLGDREAAALVGALFYASHIADDLVDMDRPDVTGTPQRRSAAVSELLSTVFVGVLANPFFRQHSVMLSGLVVSALAYWDASNEWQEDKKTETRMFGFVHREALERVLVMIAFIVGGWKHQQLVIREVHEMFHGSGAHQTFADWEAEVARGVL